MARLGKVSQELNTGMDRIVEFLQKKGVQIEKIDGNKDAEPGNLKYTLIDVEERNFASYQYFGPIPNSEVLLWSNLLQNKGW